MRLSKLSDRQLRRLIRNADVRFGGIPEPIGKTPQREKARKMVWEVVNKIFDAWRAGNDLAERIKPLATNKDIGSWEKELNQAIDHLHKSENIVRGLHNWLAAPAKIYFSNDGQSVQVWYWPYSVLYSKMTVPKDKKPKVKRWDQSERWTATFENVKNTYDLLYRINRETGSGAWEKCDPKFAELIVKLENGKTDYYRKSFHPWNKLSPIPTSPSWTNGARKIL